MGQKTWAVKQDELANLGEQAREVDDVLEVVWRWRPFRCWIWWFPKVISVFSDFLSSPQDTKKKPHLCFQHPPTAQFFF